MKTALLDFIRLNTGSVAGITELHLRNGLLVLAVPGNRTSDIERATGISGMGQLLEDQGHIHSTWLSHHLEPTTHCHWLDPEAELMWLAVPCSELL